MPDKTITTAYYSYLKPELVTARGLTEMRQINFVPVPGHLNGKIDCYEVQFSWKSQHTRQFKSYPSGFYVSAQKVQLNKSEGAVVSTSTSSENPSYFSLIQEGKRFSQKSADLLKDEAIARGLEMISAIAASLPTVVD